jgi:hypothetical protein
VQVDREAADEYVSDPVSCQRVEEIEVEHPVNMAKLRFAATVRRGALVRGQTTQERPAASLPARRRRHPRKPRVVPQHIGDAQHLVPLGQLNRLREPGPAHLLYDSAKPHPGGNAPLRLTPLQLLDRLA